MKLRTEVLGIVILLTISFSCQQKPVESETTQSQTIKEMTAKDILGKADYLAISYGGYRENSRDIQPTMAQLKEDLKILSAMDIKILRTYNTQLKQASNILAAIRELKNEDPSFEMYVMLGLFRSFRRPLSILKQLIVISPSTSAKRVGRVHPIVSMVQMVQKLPMNIKKEFITSRLEIGQMEPGFPASILKHLMKIGKMPKIQEARKITLDYLVSRGKLNMPCGT